MECARCYFYAVMIPLIIMGYGLADGRAGRERIYRLALYLFPLQSEHYWFAASYYICILVYSVFKCGGKSDEQESSCR